MSHFPFLKSLFLTFLTLLLQCCNVASYILQMCLCVCAAQVTREVCSCNSAQSPVLGQYAGWRRPAGIMHLAGEILLTPLKREALCFKKSSPGPSAFFPQWLLGRQLG